MFRDNLSVPSSRVKQSPKILQGQAESSWTAWTLNVGSIGCAETSVTKYHYTVCKIPEERWSKDKVLVFCCVTVCSDNSIRTTDVSKGPAASIMRFHSDYKGRGFLWKVDNFLPVCRSEGSHLYIYHSERLQNCILST